MKTFRYHVDGKEIAIRLDEKQGTVADFRVDGAHPAVREEDMPAYAAVISLALIEHEVEVVHDEETGVIPAVPHSQNWANPVEMMYSL